MAAALLLGVLGCGAAPHIDSCDPADGVTPVCGFHNPEDMVALPGDSWLVVSQMRRGDAGGSLVAWRVSDGAQQPLWPGGPAAPAAGWGDSACPGPPDDALFAPHGVDVFTRRTAGTGLLAINHGGRESVEVFEVGFAGGRPALFWRGCVPAPPQAWPNDVAARPEGQGFVLSKSASHPMSELKPGTVLNVLLGRPTGAAYEWTPAGGWREIPGTRGTLPNGVAVSPDGERVYVALSGPGIVVAVNRDGSDREEVAVGMRPDNFAWGAAGKLVIAGGTGSNLDALGCTRIPSGACGVSYRVSEIDPVSLETRTLLERDGSSAFGMASVAVPVGGELILGSFVGDRIARARP